jgi:hypothetical protein
MVTVGCGGSFSLARILFFVGHCWILRGKRCQRKKPWGMLSLLRTQCPTTWTTRFTKRRYGFRLRDFLGRRRTPTAAVGPFPVPPAVETERPALTPAQVAGLEVAWSELREVAQKAGVESFSACTRDGSHWEENPRLWAGHDAHDQGHAGVHSRSPAGRIATESVLERWRP